VTQQMQTIPQTNGEAPLPKRSAPKGMLPSTWTNRSVRVEYIDSSGVGQETSGVLLDVFPVGPVLSMNGAKALISWDRLAVVELLED
jgi:hypothetical protein